MVLMPSSASLLFRGGAVDAPTLAQFGGSIRPPPTCRSQQGLRRIGAASPAPAVATDAGAPAVVGAQRTYKGTHGATPPHRFICPITMEVMSDPHMTRSGINYEKAAIEQWLRTNRCDPSTREAMTTRDLFPNRALREEIAEWHRQTRRGGRPPPAAPPPQHRPPAAPHNPYNQQPRPAHRPQPAAPPPPRPAPARHLAPPARDDPARPWIKYGLTQDAYDFVCALFINFDDDDGGTLDRQELTRLARWLNYPHSAADIDRMFRAMDTDGNGELDMDEFLQYYMDKKPDPQKTYGMGQQEYNQVLMQFHTYDGDGNGSLDKDEFFRLCKSVGYARTKQDSDRIFNQVDDDRSNSIELHEFLQYMKPFRQAQPAPRNPYR